MIHFQILPYIKSQLTLPICLEYQKIHYHTKNIRILLIKKTKDEDHTSENNIKISKFHSWNKITFTNFDTVSFHKRWMGLAIKSEISGLFDNISFVVSERPLPPNEIIPDKLACKTKLKIYSGLDRLEARVYLRWDRRIKYLLIFWSPIAFTRLLRLYNLVSGSKWQNYSFQI